MIAEFWINLGTSISIWFASLWPEFTPPAWVSGFPDRVNSLLASLSGVGVWAEWGYIAGVVGFVIVVYISGFVIRFARWVWSLIPLVGGGS